MSLCKILKNCNSEKNAIRDKIAPFLTPPLPLGVASRHPYGRISGSPGFSGGVAPFFIVDAGGAKDAVDGGWGDAG